MTTDQYFNEELHVHFTCSELTAIMHALADESHSLRTQVLNYSAEEYWNLRKKVKSFRDLYESSVVL